MNWHSGIMGLLGMLLAAFAIPAEAGVRFMDREAVTGAPHIERAILPAPDNRHHVRPRLMRVQFLQSPYPRRPRLIPRRKPPPAFRPPRRVPRDGVTREGRRISPSQALRKALRVSPGSMGLGVELLPGAPPVYAVKLKTGSRIHRVLVDALSGRVLK